MDASQLRTSLVKPRLLAKALCFFSLFFLVSGYVHAQTCQGIDLGANANLNGFLPFSGDPNNAWNQDISNLPADAAETALVFSSANSGVPPSTKLHPDFGPGGGIPYVIVDSAAVSAVNMGNIPSGPPGTEASQSDNVVEPAPADAPIEGNQPDCLNWPNAFYVGDNHMLVIDRNQCWLYETYNTDRCNGVFNAQGQALWDLQNYEQRPLGWTSTDAAGLPVFAGLAKYDEATNGLQTNNLAAYNATLAAFNADAAPLNPGGWVQHAFRFTVSKTKGDSNGGYMVFPATHAASYSSRGKVPSVMGMRIRLKNDGPTLAKIASYSPTNQALLLAMAQYGMILADNGSNMFVSGDGDPRWSVDDLGDWHGGPMPIIASDFEVVEPTPEFNSAFAAINPTNAQFIAVDDMGIYSGGASGTFTGDPNGPMDANSAPYSAESNYNGDTVGLGPEGTNLDPTSPTFGALTGGIAFVPGPNDVVSQIAPVINQFTVNGGQTNITVNHGQAITFHAEATGASYSYIDNAGPIRLSSTTCNTPGANCGNFTMIARQTQTYTLNSMNAFDIAQTGVSPTTVPSITVTVNGSGAPVPLLTPMTGTYSTVQLVTITVPGYPQAAIYYTTDGLTTPTVNSTLYTGPIAVTNATTQNSQYITGEDIQAIAVIPGVGVSQVGNGIYVVNAAAATPTFSVSGGADGAPQNITISDTTLGSDAAFQPGNNGYVSQAIYFTTDGSTPAIAPPDPSDPLGLNGWTPTGTTQVYCAASYNNGVVGGNYDPNYAGCSMGGLLPIVVSTPTTINAIAVATSYTSSAVASGMFPTFGGGNASPAATPIFSVPAGTYNGDQTVTISVPQVGVDGTPAIIYYTLDGSMPTINSTMYTGPITISATTTVNAIATATGFTSSAVGSATYNLPITFNLVVAPTIVNAIGGSTGATAAVTITSENGFNGPVTLACSGLPNGDVCIFSPPTVTPAAGGTAQATITISAAGAPLGGTSSNRQNSFPMFPGATLAVALCFFGLRNRRRLQMFVLLAVSVVGLGLFTGCSNASSIPPNIKTVVVTVTGTSGSAVVTTNFTLNIY